MGLRQIFCYNISQKKKSDGTGPIAFGLERKRERERERERERKKEGEREKERERELAGCCGEEWM